MSELFDRNISEYARSVLRSAACAVLLGASALAQNPVVQPGTALFPEPGSPFVDRKESWIEIEVPPYRPILSLSVYGPLIGLVQQSAMRFAILSSITGEKLLEFPMGPGVCAAVLAPGGREIWMLDNIASCITVLDLDKVHLTRTIPVGAQPHDLQFHPSGDRVYVSCAALNRIDVVSTSTYQVVACIPVPVHEPRGLAFADGVLWVAPFFSGNGTTLHELPDLLTGKTTHLIVDADQLPGAIPLPDRDLVAIVPDALDPTLDAYDPTRDVRALGTILFDVSRRPGTTELWVPNTEALNGEFVGEVNFVAGQVVSNRISIVDATGATAPILLDLDALAPAGVRCAQPTSVAFHAGLGEAYVAGYGSDVIAVLDTTGSVPVWKGHVRLTSSSGERVGVRNLLVEGDSLLAFNRGQVSLTRIDLAGGISGEVLAPLPMTLGADPTPPAVRRGRMQLSDANHSKSQTSSCASCHVDGHIDLIGWDLSGFLDPEGTPEDQLTFEVDRKGPMLTQSMRDLSRTTPLHWRGEKPSLEVFNSTFVNLMEREVGGLPAALSEQEFDDIIAYSQSLAWPANPLQQADRSLTPQELEGQMLFTEVNTNPQGTCSACHRAPFGTSGELLNISLAQQIPEGFVVPHLRGIAQRSAQAHDLGLGGPMVSELGFGLSHSGLRNSVPAFIAGIATFQLDASQSQSVEAFLHALDTGLAPSTARQFTIQPSDAASGSSAQLDALLADAERGWCDVVVTAGFANLGSGLETLTAVYDPVYHRLQLPFQSLQVPPTLLLAYSAVKNVELTIYGLPVGMGWRIALDPDDDGALSGDEKLAGTSPDDADSDDDGFADGHELRNGMDPLVPDASSTDTTAPSFLNGPAGTPVVTVWRNTRTLQIEFATDEPTRAEIFLEGALEPSSVSPQLGGLRTYHQAVVTDLPFDSPVSLVVRVTDAAGWTNSTLYSDQTEALAVPDAVRVEAIDLGISHSELTLTVTTTDRLGNVPPDGLRVEAFVYLRDGLGALHLVEQSLFAPVVSGVASGVFPLPQVPGAAGERTVFVGVRSIRKLSPGLVLPTYVEALDAINFTSVNY